VDRKNIKELLEREYETRIEYLSLMDYYTNKLEDTPNLKYIYVVWISNLKDKIEGCDIQIQYLQKEIYS